MWKTVILLLFLCGTTLATPIVGLKKNMEIVMPEEVKKDQVSEEKMSSNEKSEIAMTTLNLPSNATSIRADIVDGFSCKNRAYGYYADVENDCQIFHVCMPVVYADGRENTFRWSFICPEETVFSQDSFTCMREEDMSFGCEDSVKFYELNRNFGIIDSSMEIHSNEAEMSSDVMGMGDTNMEESMIEKKQENQQKTMIETEKIEKIQKRVDELKPESPKPAKSHKKKNSLRKTPTRKVTTTTVIPATATEQVTPSTTLATSSLLEVEITTAKIVEKPTTKYQRFTRRPDTNKENKKKLEQVPKQEPVTVGPIKDSSKKPFKTESITVPKRKRPHVPSALKHKFNGEEKPLKNALKTSEVIKISTNQEQNFPNKINIKKDSIRPPIPEPILIRIEEQPAQLKPTELPLPLLMPEVSAIPLSEKPSLPILPILAEEKIKKKPVKILSTVMTSTVTNNNTKNEEKELLKNKDDAINNPPTATINDINPTTVINMNIENIPSQESVKLSSQQKNEFVEKAEGSLPPKKEELLEEHQENESNNNMNIKGNKEETKLNENKQDSDGSFDNNNQPIDQQSMIINLISSLVNAENSKVEDGADKIENSQYVIPHLEQSQQQPPKQENIKEPELQPVIMDNVKFHDKQEEQKQSNNDEFLELTTNNILSNDHQEKDDDEKIKNSDHDQKTSSANNEDDNLTENINENNKPELNQFDAMQKFIHQQHELYNHMTHIPVKLLTDDQFENYQTKGDLSNSDALNVIQRIEQLLQDEVKDENPQSDAAATDVEEMKPDETLNETVKELELKMPEKGEKKMSSEVQQSSEEIRPIYHRTIDPDPLNANLLKDSVMSVDENKPIVKDTVEPVKLETPILEPTSNLLKVDASVLESLETKDSPAAKLEQEPPLKTELLESLPDKDENLKPESLKVELNESKPKDVEVKVTTKLDSFKSDTVKEEPLISSSLSENKSDSTQLDSLESQTKTEKSPESTTVVKKLDEPTTVSEPSSNTVRTSSRSLKFKTRITDPRKRRFLFKADA